MVALHLHRNTRDVQSNKTKIILRHKTCNAGYHIWLLFFILPCINSYLSASDSSLPRASGSSLPFASVSFPPSSPSTWGSSDMASILISPTDCHEVCWTYPAGRSELRGLCDKFVKISRAFFFSLSHQVQKLHTTRIRDLNLICRNNLFQPNMELGRENWVQGLRHCSFRNCTCIQTAPAHWTRQSANATTDGAKPKKPLRNHFGGSLISMEGPSLWLLNQFGISDPGQTRVCKDWL